MDFIEIKGKTVQEALTNAAVELKTTSDKLEYEVVSTGSAGFLGFIGSKPAIIRVRKKEDTDGSWKFDSSEMIGKTFDNLRKENEKADRQFESEKQSHAAKQDRKSSKPAHRNENAAKPSRSSAPQAEKPVKKAESEKPVKPVKDAAPEPKKSEVKPEATKTEQAENAQTQEKEVKPISPDLVPETEEFLRKLFDAMNMQDATFKINLVPEERCMNIDVEGENMGLLIGKRGQTLDALQYIINLVVNKKSESYIRIKLDTENYRDRRRATLENLAKNIAFKVKRTRKPVVLEPMNPYERRIIHSALQSDRYVDTHSEGDEPYRKVVVTLKKEYRGRKNNSRGGYGKYNGRRNDRSRQERRGNREAEKKTDAAAVNAEMETVKAEEKAAENAAAVKTEAEPAVNVSNNENIAE